MKYFLPSICAFSIFALLLVPAHAQQEETISEEPDIVETDEGQEEQIVENDCLELGVNCDGDEPKKERAKAREEFRINVQSRLSTIRARAEERRESNGRVRVKQEVQQRIELSLEKTITQFENTIYRLSSIADRLENRLTALNERGFDVASSLDALDDARIEITLSTEAIASVAQSIDEALSSDTPRSARATLQSSLKETRTSLRNAREALLRAVAIGRTNVTTDVEGDEQESASE